MRNRKESLKIVAAILIATTVIGILVKGIYSANDNHYVVDVVKENAVSKDENLQITEKIVKDSRQQYFDSKELNYEVELKNIMQENVETQVAMVIDSSYSMGINDPENTARAKAKEIASGILKNVKNSRISISNNSGVKLNMTSTNTNVTTNINNINNQINALKDGEGSDSNVGLDNACKTFTTPIDSKNTVKKYIIVFTDSTDEVSDKMKNLMENNSDLQIISILVDMTSTSYINNGVPTAGEVYVLPSGVSEEDITDASILDVNEIYDELNTTVENIQVSNVFSDEILTYFDITDYKTTNGELTKQDNGYNWKVNKIKFGDTEKLTFKLTLKSNMDIDAGLIFNEIYTNKTQDLTYTTYKNSDQTQLRGTDSREETESTVIKICQGYDLTVKAVNEKNQDLGVDGVSVKVEGKNEDGEIVCDITKQTDANGYVTITADDARALRGDGTITYTITPSVNKVGYVSTDAITFDITNNKTTRKLIFDNHESNLKGVVNEEKRNVEVTMPINTQRIDFELKAVENGNDLTTISGCEFELIQPKLNNKYEMDVLNGETDENGALHFAPTVMTKDGTYNYILRQVSAPDAYEVTNITLIEITYKNGIITKISKQFNPNVNTEVCTDTENHVLITVGNDCVATDPFDFQINLSDSADNSKIEGVTYLITTTNANNQVRNEYVTTNADGQINTKIYGTGNLNIKVTEQSPKVGYVADTTAKEMTVSRNNNIITVWYSTTGLDLQQSTNQEDMILNLKSTKKTSQNMVRVSLVDADEQDIDVGKNVAYYLKDTETDTKYGPSVSDKNGELSFVVDNKTVGQHRYTLIVDKTTVPDEYDTNQIADNVNFNLVFDESGYIVDENVIDTATVVKNYYSKVSNDSYVEYTCFITIGYKLEEDNTVEFRVQLNDKDNTTKALQDAKYNINIEWDINGITRTKTIKERQTNASGNLSTRIIKADQVRIYVQQVGASAGYTIDTTTQEIYLGFRNNGLTNITSQSPYDRGQTNVAEPNQGAYINGGTTVVYQHLNRKRTAEDTYVNLTINKMDTNGAYVDGVLVNLKSSRLKDKEEGGSLDNTLKTGENGSAGTIIYDYQSYLKDPENNNYIRVPGMGEEGTENSEIVYDLEISEIDRKNNDPSQDTVKDGTTVKLRLIFRKKDDRIVLTNVETIYGNRLVKNKSFSSSADNVEGKNEEDALGVYLANITLDLYTNYDDVGNLALDLKKQDNTGKELVGAEYDIKVVNPDTTVVRKHVKVDNGDGSSAIELTGLSVNVGSLIYLTETKAPIGYGVNTNAETLEVKKIADDGEITLQQIDQAYSTNRLKLEKQQSTTTSAGTVKSNYQVTLIDYSLDKFEFNINAVDSTSLNGVEGYGFNIQSSLGAQKTVTTGSDGDGTVNVGGNIENNTITYTITSNKVADYYKPFKNTIKVNVVFDVSGNVDIDSTMNAQTDGNYGTLWNIKNLETNGKINIQILLDHQDPLVVNVETVDKITNAVLRDVEYKITESQELPGTGTDTIKVGYCLENGIRTYKLEQTKISNSYAKIKDKAFTVTYTNEKVSNVTLNSDRDDDVITITGNKAIKIRVYVEPKVPFEITNLYYFENTTKLQGANFEVTEIAGEDRSTGTTSANGIAGIYAGILGTNQDLMYKIRQTTATSGYATVEDFYVKVKYNENREITEAKLVDSNGNDVEENRFITVTYAKTSTVSSYNGNTKGIVKIQVLNYPEFQMNIENVDRRDGTTKISGTSYKISSKYTTSDNSEVEFTSGNAITNENGIGLAHLDKTKDNTRVTYTITESMPGVGYQSLGKDIDVIVTFDENGYVSNVELKDNINQIASASKLETVNDDRDNFKVNVQIKNNPVLKFNLTAEDSEVHDTKIKDIGFQIVSRCDNNVYSNSSATNRVNKTDTPETSYTDINGYTASYLDRTLENKDMYYTIKEVQKSPGYNWQDKDIILKVSYDNNGKISTITPTQGGELINITSFNADNFEISMEIYNEEIKEFGIHLTTVDTYNVDKKLNGMNVEAFLTDSNNPNDYVSDGEYELIGDNALLTGADRDNNGTPDISYGEDYKSMGQYTKGAGTRTLRLVIKNDSNQTRQSGYYLDSRDGTNSGNNVGYYIGTKYYADAKYQTVAYQYLIDVTFDDEGKITNANLQTGLNQHIGWLVDGRYVQIDENNLIDHTNYKLNITLKFFPMFDLKLNAMDNYTFQSEIDESGKPISLDGARYTISTERKNVYRDKDEFVRAGYIGYGNYYGMSGSLVDGAIYEDTNELFVPIENNYTRLFYVYEDSEPTNYQKYTPRHQETYKERLVAIISVTFDKNGEIDYNNSIIRKIDENTIKPYMDESGSAYLSDNNIKEYNYYYDKESANRNINFYIGYALTTKIHVKAIDDISNNPIANIRLSPFVNDTYVSNTSYEFNTISYRDTNSNGESAWTYWGAAINDNVNKYIIGSSRNGNEYNGYFFPSDMANTGLGGSGNEADYYTELDITYDSNGKISNVQSLKADLWGDNNVANISWDSTTGNIYINMLYSRKLQVTLDKVDYYDNTINNLSAGFDVTSNRGLKTSIDARQMTPLGKVYKNTTVKYTLSETRLPDGYYPISKTIDYYITFNDRGNFSINNVKSDNEYFETVNTIENTEKVNKTTPDLTINIKNKPSFTLDLQVIDKFYKNYGLQNAYLKVTSDKGDVAAGNPQTDSRGYANVIAGPVYPSETVTYYIQQTNTIGGYYANTTTIQLQVKYNDAGKIEEYKIIKGNEIINNFNSSQYMNTRKISMQIMNMPKDLKIGLYKYDQTTNAPMSAVSFKVTKTDINSGATTQKDIVTETNGSVIAAIDTFNTSLNGKTIKYTIHENQTPASYRSMEDVVFIIRYNPDGSIASCNQVENDNGILNTKVQLNVATNGNIQMLNNERVHFKVVAPNDNAYDLIIKDEDTNYSGLGIEGTQYDVSINGVTYSPNATNSNGTTIINDLTQSGEITINIAEHQAGEGYKSDVDNKVSIKLQKGVDVYSLDLDSSTDGYVDNENATTTKAIVKINETYGNIEVTFKNETKTTLTVLNQDINSKVGLEDTEFEVLAQQIDSDGAEIGDAITLTTDDNKVTDKNGMLKFELGVAPQSQVWKYTFKEITPPENYNPIVDLTMTVTFDQYGRISRQVSSKQSRLNAIMEDSYYNCHNMYAIIYNGDVSPAYTVKVVTEDAETGKRINGSSVYMNITDATTGDLITVQPKTEASADNGSISQTFNLGIDGKTYTDNKDNSEENDVPIIVERGLTYIDNIDYEGTINIEISQKGTAVGYAYGSQHTDGNVQISTKYVPQLDDDPTVEFTVVQNDGFNVIVDNANRTITIKILNESQVGFDITTAEKATKQQDIKAIQGVNYKITAEIQTATDSILTDVDVTTPLSDENGRTTANTGKAYAGKTVVYTLHQNISDRYLKIDDIQIEVKYDSNGYIKYYELLSSQDNANISVEKTKDRTIALNVYNSKVLSGYTVYVEKHAMDTDIDEEAYDRLLSGAKYRITVNQEDAGVEYTTWTDITDENGVIEGLTFNGYGYITITLEELNAPDGYAIDSLRKIRLYRDSETGKIEEIDGDVNFTTDDDYTKIYLKPVDVQSDDKFTLILNKYSNTSNKRITEDQAEFKAEIQKLDENGEIAYKNTIENIFTDKNGKAIIDNVDMPTQAGDYKLILTEVKAPKGYEKLENPIELDVRFEKDSEGKMIVSTVSEDEEHNVTISKINKQLIGLNIGNDIDDKIQDDEYSLDLTKVDGDTNQPIPQTATYKVALPDDYNTSVYTETSETRLGPGKLDYCYIEQDKDYKVRLTHMKLPSRDGVYKYVIKEIVAPEGYAKIDEELILTLTFKKHEDGKLYIADATSSNDKYLRINTDTPSETNVRFSVDIINYPAEQNKFTIHYDANDNGEGTVVPEDQIKDKDVDITLSTTEPTRTGYTFEGWATLPNGTVAQFKPGDTFTLNQDITLYAIWEEALYLKSDKYKISNENDYATDTNSNEYVNGDKYIFGIKPAIGAMKNSEENKGTNLEELKNHITTNADKIEVIKQDNTILENGDLIGTGMKIVLTKGNRKIEIIAIVLGDVNGNGSLDGSDKTNASNFISKDDSTRFDTIEKRLSLDVNLDGKIRPSDLTVLRQALANDDNSGMGV